MAVELDGKGGPLSEADSEVADHEEAVGSAEASLEALAEEMSDVISGCPDEEREALHDYAVSLVRDALPVAADRSFETPTAGAADGSRSGRGGSGAQALGYGILLMPVGFFLFWIFPFIGVMLFVSGALMAAWGLLASLLARVKPQAVEAADIDEVG